MFFNVAYHTCIKEYFKNTFYLAHINIPQGKKRQKKWDFLPFILWVFLIIFIFVTLMMITMGFKQLEASHIMSWDSSYQGPALIFQE